MELFDEYNTVEISSHARHDVLKKLTGVYTYKEVTPRTGPVNGPGGVFYEEEQIR